MKEAAKLEGEGNVETKSLCQTLVSICSKCQNIPKLLVVADQSAVTVIEGGKLHALVNLHGAWHDWVVSCMNILQHDVGYGCEEVTKVESSVFCEYRKLVIVGTGADEIICLPLVDQNRMRPWCCFNILHKYFSFTLGKFTLHRYAVKHVAILCLCNTPSKRFNLLPITREECSPFCLDFSTLSLVTVCTTSFRVDFIASS